MTVKQIGKRLGSGARKWGGLMLILSCASAPIGVLTAVLSGLMWGLLIYSVAVLLLITVWMIAVATESSGRED